MHFIFYFLIEVKPKLLFMKLYLLIGLIALLSFSTAARKEQQQKKKTEALVKEQSGKLEIKQKAYLDSINLANIKQQITPYIVQIDSLIKVVEKQEIKQSFFDTELSSQTAIFSLIVVGLLTLGGFITFVKLKLTVRNVKKKYEESLKKYNKTTSLVKQLKHDINKEFYNQNVSLTTTFFHIDNLKNLSLLFMFRSFKILSEIQEDISKERLSTNIWLVNDLIDEFKTMTPEELSKKYSHQKAILRHIKQTKKFNNEELNDAFEEVKVLFKNLVKEEQTDTNIPI